MSGANRNSGGGTGSVVLLLVVAALFGAYYYASPYITLYRAGQAVDNADAEYLCDRINFEQLRDNIEGGFAAPATMETAMLRQMLDRGISCETVERFLDMAQLMDHRDDEDGKPGLREHASTGFESPTRFVVELGDEDAPSVQLVMSRTLLSWELTDIRLER